MRRRRQPLVGQLAVASRRGDLDIKNPRGAADLEHLPPERLVEDIIDKERRIVEIIAEIKAVLAQNQWRTTPQPPTVAPRGRTAVDRLQCGRRPPGRSLVGLVMVHRDIIQPMCDQIVAAFRPLKVILFGSYAHGAPTPDSDVDLLVIMPFDGSPIRKAAEVSQRIRRTLPVDVLVRTPECVRQRLALGDFFMREIVQKGQVLYDAADGRVGAEG